MTENPIVTWTTPWQRANKAWLEAAEHMEFHRWPQARAALHAHAKQLRLTIAQLEREAAVDEMLKRRADAAIAARPDHARERLEQLRSAMVPGGDQIQDWG